MNAYAGLRIPAQYGTRYTGGSHKPMDGVAVMQTHPHTMRGQKPEESVSVHAVTGFGAVDINGLAALEDCGAPITVTKNTELWAQGGSTDYAYRVVSGCLRLVKLMPDGRRQITEFLLPGDWLGFEGPPERDDAAEAVVNSGLRRYPRRRIDALMREDNGFARLRLNIMSRSLCQAQERMLTLGRRTAAERIAVFLLDLAARTPGGQVNLPMSRTDIGDYLGLRLETVCRILSQLQRSGAIRSSASSFLVRSRAALEACTGAA